MDETTEAPRGVFVIDGEEVPFPELAEGFDMDEAMVFYEYTGHPIEDLFMEVDEDDEDAVREYELKLRNPKTMAALMHLAYSRAHPKTGAGTIKKLVKQTDFVEAFSKLVAEDDASPPEMTSGETQPDKPSTTSSPSSSDESTERSGNGSERSSESLAAIPSRITTSESGTSSISAPEISAA